MEKIAMLDISESGRQIGKKLFAVLESKQKKELTQYIFERDKQSDVDNPVVITPNHDSSEHQGYPLTKIYEGDLFFLSGTKDSLCARSENRFNCKRV